MPGVCRRPGWTAPAVGAGQPGVDPTRLYAGKVTWDSQKLRCAVLWLRVGAVHLQALPERAGREESEVGSACRGMCQVLSQ